MYNLSQSLETNMAVHWLKVLCEVILEKKNACIVRQWEDSVVKDSYSNHNHSLIFFI